MATTTETSNQNPTWSHEGPRQCVPGPILHVLRALLSWGEEHGLDSNTFSATELSAYRGILCRRIYKLGAWLNEQKRSIHWVDSEGVNMRLTITYERGLFFTHVWHREATFSGLARVVNADKSRLCATQRHGVGRHSCVREWEHDELAITGESIEAARVAYNGFEPAGATL
jgi:hypothetical protein